jgi:hypothetical protein
MPMTKTDQSCSEQVSCTFRHRLMYFISYSDICSIFYWPVQYKRVRINTFVVDSWHDNQPSTAQPNDDQSRMQMLEDINNCIVHQLTSAGCVGWAFGGHYGKILGRQVQTRQGAQLGGVDFHQSRQSTTLSQQQSNSREIKDNILSSLGRYHFYDHCGGFTSQLLVLDQLYQSHKKSTAK